VDNCSLMHRVITACRLQHFGFAMWGRRACAHILDEFVPLSGEIKGEALSVWQAYPSGR
jgi:hypothetical protein